MGTRHTVVQTTLGPITIVADGSAVTGLYFEDHLRRPAQDDLGPSAVDPLLMQAAGQLQEYLQGRRQAFQLPLSADGDPFQQSVWAILQRIPFGATTSYGRIAEQLGDRALAQRVGQAVGANPLCVFVPCHRVLGADGSLTGYAGGLDRKRALLQLEEPPAQTAGRLF